MRETDRRKTRQGGRTGQAVQQRSHGAPVTSNFLPPFPEHEEWRGGGISAGQPMTWEEGASPVFTRLTWGMKFKATLLGWVLNLWSLMCSCQHLDFAVLYLVCLTWFTCLARLLALVAALLTLLAGLLASRVCGKCVRELCSQTCNKQGNVWGKVGPIKGVRTVLWLCCFRALLWVITYSYLTLQLVVQ